MEEYVDLIYNGPPFNSNRNCSVFFNRNGCETATARNLCLRKGRVEFEREVKGDAKLNEWPEEFPDTCPPMTGVPSQGRFYRLVFGEELSERDFLSNYKEKPRRFDGWDGALLCQAMGTSLCASQEDIEYTRDSVGPLRSRLIAHGAIDGSGVMAATPAKGKPSHHTWWRPLGEDKWKDFSVI